MKQLLLFEPAGEFLKIPMLIESPKNDKLAIERLTRSGNTALFHFIIWMIIREFNGARVLHHDTLDLDTQMTDWYGEKL
jgi:hypothetical protein